MDKLEKFIKENRNDFDNKIPPDDTWEGISGGLETKPVSFPKINQWLWKAASLILLMAVIGLLVERNMHRELKSPANQANERLSELNKVEAYYTSLISQKRQEIQKYLRDNPDFRKSFNQDISQLDSMYSGLKNELSDTYNDKIVDAMIVNLQLRIKILNQQLNILQSIQKTKENENANI